MTEFTTKVLNEWATQLGRKPEELQKMYDDAYEVLTKMGKPADQIEEMAKTRVRSQLRHDFASPAIPFRGRVLAKGDAFNMNATAWTDAAEYFKGAESQQWIDKGVINDKGEPLDTREIFSKSKKKNPNFGKVMPKENFLTNVFGVFISPKEEVVASKVTMSGNKARIAIPVDVPVHVRLNDKSEKGATFRTLVSGAPTEFKPIEDPDIPDAETLISNYCAQFFTTLKQLEAVHQAFVPAGATKADPTRLTIVEVELITLDTEANPKTHNYRMVVGDESLGFSEKERRGTVVWTSEALFPAVKDAGRGSRMFVIGQTTQPQTSRDFATGDIINKPGDVGINAMGIYVKKGWLMPKDEQPYEATTEVA